MGKLIFQEEIKHGVLRAEKVYPLTPDAQEAVERIQAVILGLEQTPESLAYQIHQNTAPRAKAEVARVISYAFQQTDREFASQTIANMFPKVQPSNGGTHQPVDLARHQSIRHWWENIGIPQRNPT